MRDDLTGDFLGRGYDQRMCGCGGLAKSMGRRRLYAANTSGASEAVYQRRARMMGIKLRPVCQWYEVNIGDPDDSDPGFQVRPPIERIFDFDAAQFQAMRAAVAIEHPRLAATSALEDGLTFVSEVNRGMVKINAVN